MERGWRWNDRPKLSLIVGPVLNAATRDTKDVTHILRNIVMIKKPESLLLYILANVPKDNELRRL